MGAYGYLLDQMGEVSSTPATDPTTEPSVEDTAEGEAHVGPLLTEKNPKKIVATLVKQWKSLDKGLSKTLCEIEQAERWRAGEKWVYLRPANDDKSWMVWRPPGVDRLPPLPDKVDELCRRVVAQLMVDPPKLKAVPMTGEEADEQSAELATRILQAEGTESNWNLRLVREGALDVATTQKSAFAHVTLNPVGGGRQPVTVMAHPMATGYDESQPEACTLDPQTGQPSADLVTKYLNPDNTLTDAQTEQTVMRWVPDVDIRVLGARHVRFFPEFSRGLDDAQMVLVAEYDSVGMLKARYPDTVGQMDEIALRKLVNWQPFEDKQILLPEFVRDPKEMGTQMNKDEVADDQMALVLYAYCQQSPTYPSGARLCVGGGEFVLMQDDLEVDVERPDGTHVADVLDIPVSQCRCLNDWVGLNPYGIALVTKLGPWNELMAQQWNAVMDWLDRFNHPHQYLPLNSIVQPGQMETRSGAPILVDPNGQPFTEQVPPLPPAMSEWYDRSVDGMNNASGLQEAAQGVDSPNAVSGTTKQIVIEQALVAIASIQQNAADFQTRLARLILQFARAYLTVPQTVKYTGDDGAYKADEWRGADLHGVKDVQIESGSGTLLNPEYKQQKVMELLQMQMISPDDAKELVLSGAAAPLGMQDDPVRQRIKRQIDGLLEQNAPLTPLPVDEVPAVAQQRFRELAKVQMTTRFAKAAPEAQQQLVAEYDRMRQAAGIQTKAEEAQAAQQQQESAMQAEQQKAQMDAQAKLAESQAKTEQEIRLKQAEAEIAARQTAMQVAAPNPPEMPERLEPPEAPEAPDAPPPAPPAVITVNVPPLDLSPLALFADAVAPKDINVNVTVPSGNKAVRMVRNAQGGFDAAIQTTE